MRYTLKILFWLDGAEWIYIYIFSFFHRKHSASFIRWLAVDKCCHKSMAYFPHRHNKKSQFNELRFSYGERGIWTLAPVTRPTPLAGAPLQPLEYFSSTHYYTRVYIYCQYSISIFLFFLNYVIVKLNKPFLLSHLSNQLLLFFFTS